MIYSDISLIHVAVLGLVNTSYTIPPGDVHLKYASSDSATSSAMKSLLKYSKLEASRNLFPVGARISAIVLHKDVISFVTLTLNAVCTGTLIIVECCAVNVLVKISFVILPSSTYAYTD